jgi:hypothetical protein
LAARLNFFVFLPTSCWQPTLEIFELSSNVMAEKTAPPIKKLTDKSTKHEMLEAYQALAKQLEEKRATELAPERRVEEKKTEEAVRVATGVAPDGIDREIGNLKAEMGKMLADISERLAAEAGRFRHVQKAVESKENELKELYGIEKSAVSLAALIEAQNQKRHDFETQTAQERDELQSEMETRRSEWEEEKKSRETEIREREAAEKKTQDRAREDFNYAFKREQQAIKDKLNDEKLTLEKEIKLKRETADKEFAEREKAIAEKEGELADLRDRAVAFPNEKEAAVAAAVKETSDRLKLEAKNREDLLLKQFEGERNVLTARNDSLEKTNKDLLAANARLSQQLEAAYQKVQDIAEKTVEGSSQSRSLADLQKLFFEQNRKGRDEKA